MISHAMIQTPLTGRDYHGDQSQSMQALAQFYHALNARDLEFMQMHPIVSIALEYYKSGIAGAEFWGGPDQKDSANDKGRPISPSERVSQFVLMHAERF